MSPQPAGNFFILLTGAHDERAFFMVPHVVLQDSEDGVVSIPLVNLVFGSVGSFVSVAATRSGAWETMATLLPAPRILIRPSHFFSILPNFVAQ